MPGGDCRAATPRPHHLGVSLLLAKPSQLPDLRTKPRAAGSRHPQTSRLGRSQDEPRVPKPRPAINTAARQEKRAVPTPPGSMSLGHGGRAQTQRKAAGWELRPRFPGSSHALLPAALVFGDPAPGSQSARAGGMQQAAALGENAPHVPERRVHPAVSSGAERAFCLLETNTKMSPKWAMRDARDTAQSGQLPLSPLLLLPSASRGHLLGTEEQAKAPINPVSKTNFLKRSWRRTQLCRGRHGLL